MTCCGGRRGLPSRPHGLLVAVVTLGLLAGCGAAPVAGDAAAGTSSTVAGTPSSAAAESTESPQVVARGFTPVGLEIPAIDVRSDVVPVGAVDRVLQVPPQPWVVGWWRDGVGVGAASGSVVLTAHLDSNRYGTGPFARASHLRQGDEMVVRDVGGMLRRFVAVAVDVYRKERLPYERLFDQDGPVRVVLVTCGGRYRPASGGWDSNVVVTFAPDAG